jgi:hypothetical protein
MIEEKRESIVEWFVRAVAEYGLDGASCSDDGYAISEDDGDIIGMNRQASTRLFSDNFHPDRPTSPSQSQNWERQERR